MKKIIHYLLSKGSNFVACPPPPLFCNNLPPGRSKKLVKFFLKRGPGFCFEKCKSYIICYRMNVILSFAPPFFNSQPPGTQKKACKNCFERGAEDFFLKWKLWKISYRLSTVLSFAPHFLLMSPGRVLKLNWSWVFGNFFRFF